MSEFTYLSPFIADPNLQKVAAGAVLGTAFCLLGRSLTRSIPTGEIPDQQVIPPQKINLFWMFDFLIEAFINFHDGVLGKENRRYAPFSGAVFLFILSANLLGLIPGMPAITTTVWVNVAMALTTFVYFNYRGIKTHGVKGYIKHFMGPMLAVSILVFPVEIFSTCLRVLILNLRLYWNISADHIVLGIFMGIFKEMTGVVRYLPVPALVYVLGVFVSFMQALIFTVLTMVYILLATQHEEEDHEH